MWVGIILLYLLLGIVSWLCAWFIDFEKFKYSSAESPMVDDQMEVGRIVCHLLVWPIFLLIAAIRIIPNIIIGIFRIPKCVAYVFVGCKRFLKWKLKI